MILPWGKVMEMVIDEPEHLVKKNLTFSKILPGFEYWTREGKISKIYIIGLRSLPTMDFMIIGRFVMLLAC